MDHHIRSRLTLGAAIVVLLLLGGIRPESYPLFRAVIIVPGAFLLAAFALLALPFLLMEHAEGEHVPWRRLLHFLGHNWALPIATSLLLAAVVWVSFVNFDNMVLWEKAVFFVAASTGVTAGLTEWFRDLQPEEPTRSPH